jgi:hypothetical protein
MKSSANPPPRKQKPTDERNQKNKIKKLVGETENKKKRKTPTVGVVEEKFYFGYLFKKAPLVNTLPSFFLVAQAG